MTAKMTKTDEMFARITDRIVDAIAEGQAGKWQKPWTAILGGTGLHSNASTKRAYLGMNQLVLMAVAATEGYAVPVWATYKQFKALGGQVRKGEKGVELVKWGRSYTCDDCGAKGQTPCQAEGHTSSVRMWASSFYVFNVAQQDGFVWETGLEGKTAPERMADAEAFVAATGADIVHVAQDKAYYTPATDRITLPLREQFQTTQGYYGTLFHELTHWTGHASRLDRKGGVRFGDDRYAAEELVAELGATFLAAQFGVETDPHPEHVAYLASWLSALKSDPRTLYRAARDAQAAVEFLNEVAQANAGAEAEGRAA